MHSLRIPQCAALSNLHRIHVADQVPDRGIRRSQLLGIALVAVPPLDRQLVAQLRSQAATTQACWRVRVIMDLASSDLRAPFIQKPSDRPHQPGLTLTALTEQHEIMAGEYRAFELRQHCLVEADNAREGVASSPKPLNQVVAKLSLDPAIHISGRPELAPRDRL